jgi:hypothetical protein
MSSKMQYVMGLVVNRFRASPPEESPVRPRNPKMDAFMKHIHHNKELTVENLAKAMDAEKDKKTAR